MRTFWKRNFELKKTAFPDCLFFSGDANFPFLEVHHAGTGVADGFREEAEGVVAAPLFPVLVLSIGWSFRVKGGRTSPQRAGSCTATLLRGCARLETFCSLGSDL